MTDHSEIWGIIFRAMVSSINAKGDEALEAIVTRAEDEIMALDVINWEDITKRSI